MVLRSNPSPGRRIATWVRMSSPGRTDIFWAYRFQPAREHGKPVPVELNVEVPYVGSQGRYLRPAHTACTRPTAKSTAAKKQDQSCSAHHRRRATAIRRTCTSPKASARAWTTMPSKPWLETADSSHSLWQTASHVGYANRNPGPHPYSSAIMWSETGSAMGRLHQAPDYLGSTRIRMVVAFATGWPFSTNGSNLYCFTALSF